MTNEFGKRTTMNLNGEGISTRGVCTWMCPYTCKGQAAALCGCKGSDAKNKASGYDKNYNSLIHGNRTPSG